MTIVEGDRERVRRGMEANKRLNKDVGIMDGKLRVNEAELKGEQQRGRRLEEELEEGVKKKLEEMKKHKKVRVNESDKSEWDKVERKVVECVRSVVREEMRNDRNINRMRRMNGGMEKEQMVERV